MLEKRRMLKRKGEKREAPGSGRAKLRLSRGLPCRPRLRRQPPTGQSFELLTISGPLHPNGLRQKMCDAKMQRSD
jgi:hypothetical protein